MKKAKGFTLIELLVVISVIGLLSSVVLASLNGARMKARDAKRIASLKEMQKALELYYDNNGYYPSNAHGLDVNHAIGYDTACGGTPGCGHCNRWCTLDTALAPWLSKAPRDPLGTTQAVYYYSYSSNLANDQLYGLSAVLESPNSIAANDGGFYSYAFELGPQPVYCKQKYNADWLNRDITGDWARVCDSTTTGGN